LRRILACSAALALAAGVHAQGSDELWEVSSQMNMAGLPPGMGSTTQRICRDKDPKKEPASRKDMEGCKVTDMKESGNRFTMTMTCPQGTMVIDQTYNSARTEYKGTMKMKSREGDMTMNVSGRKVGSCNAQQARQEQAAQVAAMQQQGKKAQADADAAMAKHCRTALDNMDATSLGMLPQCKPNQAEFCKRYQTLDGFLKAKGDDKAAQLCNVAREPLQASLCARAVKQEHLPFLGRFCPVEGKAYAQQHCAGRDFTSAPQDKYTQFCRSHLANRDLDGGAPSSAAEQRPAPTQGEKAKQAVTDGVQQGINKLKGLFGR
jgi:hypothetical protein